MKQWLGGEPTMQAQNISSLLPYTDWSLDRESLALSLDAVLPEQVWADPVSTRAGCPEAVLMRAVLEDAIICFQHQFYMRSQRAKRLAREAEAWFFDDDTQWPFAFVNICTILGLNPEYIRAGLRNWYRTHPAKLPQRKRRASGVRGTLKLAA
jgi:hypothetical protein